MKLVQLDLLAELELSGPKPVTINDVFYGNVARHKKSGAILMRVKPTGFLLNSNVIGDILNRGDCLVVNMSKGTLHSVVEGTVVEPLLSKLSYVEKPLK